MSDQWNYVGPGWASVVKVCLNWQQMAGFALCIFKCSVTLSQLLPDLVMERRMRWKTSDPHRCGNLKDGRLETKRWRRSSWMRRLAQGAWTLTWEGFGGVWTPNISDGVFETQSWMVWNLPSLSLCLEGLGRASLFMLKVVQFFCTMLAKLGHVYSPIGHMKPGRTQQ